MVSDKMIAEVEYRDIADIAAIKFEMSTVGDGEITKDWFS